MQDYPGKYPDHQEFKMGIGRGRLRPQGEEGTVLCKYSKGQRALGVRWDPTEGNASGVEAALRNSSLSREDVG